MGDVPEVEKPDANLKIYKNIPHHQFSSPAARVDHG
jgi:hypothetical protein